MKIKSMFILTFVFALFACFAGNVSAASEPKDPTAIYTAGEIQVEALAFSDTDDLQEFDSGGGIAATYWHYAQLGLGFEGRSQNTSHAVFDTIGLNLAGRIPLEDLKAAVIGRIGFDYHAEQVDNPRANDFDVYVGVGIEKRIHRYTIGAEVRGVRAAELAPQESVQFLVRVGRAF